MLKPLLLSHLVPVRVATTEAERQAVFRHRYQVYVEELKKEGVANADHARRLIRDPEDDRELVRLYYTGPADAPTGSVRCELYRPGELTGDLIRKFSLDLYPEITEEPISIIRYMITSKSARGKLVPARFAIEAFRWTVLEHGSRFSFSTAPPAVVMAYRRVGYRPYAARLVDTPDGVRIPVVNVWSDHAFHRAQGSPIAGMSRRAFGARRLPPVDMDRYRWRIHDDASGFRFDPKAVRTEVLALFDRSALIFDGIDRNDAGAIASVATLMDIGRDQVLYRRGLFDRELYVITSGGLDAFAHGLLRSEYEPGDVVGAQEMLSEAGLRTATVTAREDTTVLVLTRSSLRRLLEKAPAVFGRLALNLARVLANDVCASVADADDESGEVSTVAVQRAALRRAPTFVPLGPLRPRALREER